MNQEMPSIIPLLEPGLWVVNPSRS